MVRLRDTIATPAFEVKMKPANLLFILSDEHNRRVLGCSGHKMIRTPNLARLPASGGGFRAASTSSPLRGAVQRRPPQFADLRAGAGGAGDRAVRSSDPVLGQRHSL